VFIPGYTGYVHGMMYTHAGTYARTARDSHFDVNKNRHGKMGDFETPNCDAFYPERPNPRRKTNVSNRSEFILGDDRDWSFDTTTQNHFAIPTKIPPRHVSIFPAGKTNKKEELQKVYNDALQKIGMHGVKKLELDIRAKVHQKTSSEKGPMALRRAFKFFDNDESGGIDPDEFHAAMGNFGLQFNPDQILALYCAYDRDYDGELSYAEFVENVMEGGTREAREEMKKLKLEENSVQWVLKSEEVTPIKSTVTADKDHCLAVFRKHDVNGTGSIDLRELQRLTESLGLFMGQEEINGAMIDLDKDGSGDIDVDEFWEWWQKTVAVIQRRSPYKSSSQRPNAQTSPSGQEDKAPDSSDSKLSLIKRIEKAAGQTVERSRRDYRLNSHLCRVGMDPGPGPWDSPGQDSSGHGSPSMFRPNSAMSSRSTQPKVGGWITNEFSSPGPRTVPRPSSAMSTRSTTSTPGYYGKGQMPLGSPYKVPHSMERAEYTPQSQDKAVSRPQSAPGWRPPANGTRKPYMKDIGYARMPAFEQTGFRV